MPKQQTRSLPPSRHSYEAVSLEIQRFTRQVRGRHKELAARLDLTSQQLSHRLRGVQVELTVDELGVIADWAHAPLGWPLIPWELAQEMQNALTKNRKAR